MTKFWVEDPSVLFGDLTFFPTETMTREQKLNALTRLALVIALVMYLTHYEQWMMFLLIVILTLVIINYASKKNSEKYTPVDEIPSNSTLVENFTIVPTHITDDFSSTVVAPTFAEEWRLPVPSYDHNNNLNAETNVEVIGGHFDEPIRPQVYPYGQYLTRTNLMPGDEYAVATGSTGGAKSAREYVNSAFLRHDLARREDLTRTYKKSMQRRFRHNTGDTVSPYYSY